MHNNKTNTNKNISHKHKTTTTQNNTAQPQHIQVYNKKSTHILNNKKKDIEKHTTGKQHIAKQIDHNKQTTIHTCIKTSIIHKAQYNNKRKQ